jgi:hypothetical protein
MLCAPNQLDAQQLRSNEIGIANQQTTYYIVMELHSRYIGFRTIVGNRHPSTKIYRIQDQVKLDVSEANERGREHTQGNL